MGVMKYMQDGGPSFMSYRRKPTLNVSVPPPREVKRAPAYAGTDFDFDRKANEGDKQLLYNRHMEQQNALKGLFGKYGGETQWMQEDPEYKKAMQIGRWDVYDSQSAEFNYDLGVERNSQLTTKGSGQNPSDFEMVRHGSVYVPAETGANGFLNKSEFLTHNRRNPQTFVREDGSIGILETQYDRNTGDMATNVHGVWDKLLTGGNIGSNARGHDESQRNKIGYTGEMTHAVDILKSSGYDSSSNWEQIDDAIAFVKKYGFDDQTEYALYQSLYDDIEEGRPLNRPVRDEEGKIVVDGEGNVQYERSEIAPELVTAARAGDPRALSEIEDIYNDYVTQKFIDYSKKFRKSSYTDREAGYDIRTGYDPTTGAAVDEPKGNTYWTEMGENDGSWTGQTKMGGTWVPDPENPGKFKQITEGTRFNPETGEQEQYSNLRYEDDASIDVFMDQSRASLVDETIGNTTTNNDWDTKDKTPMMQVDGVWQEIPSGWLDAKINDVVGYEEMIAPNGTIVHGNVVEIIVDDDDNQLQSIQRMNGTTQHQVFQSGWMGTSGVNYLHTDTPTDVARTVSRENLTEEEQGRIHHAYGSYDDPYVIRVTIPTSKTATTLKDTYDFGTAQKVKTGVGTTEAIRNMNAAQMDQDANITNAVEVGGN